MNNLSYSKISSLLKCPRAFYYRYIEKLPQPVPGRMLAGRCYHQSLALAESHKLITNELISQEEIADSFSTFWNAEKQDKLIYDKHGGQITEATFIDWGEDKESNLKNDGLALVKLYIKTKLPKLNIVAVEEKLETRVEGIPFIGYLDFRTPKVIGDHKFSRRALSQDAIDRDAQPSAYALLMGKPIKFEYHQALSIKKREIKVGVTSRNLEDIEWFKQLVRDMWKLVQSGNFYCNSSGWWCAPDYCPFWLQCKHSSF